MLGDWGRLSNFGEQLQINRDPNPNPNPNYSTLQNYQNPNPPSLFDYSPKFETPAEACSCVPLNSVSLRRSGFRGEVQLFTNGLIA